MAEPALKDSLNDSGPWSVYRQDTHGTVFEIRRDLSEDFARAVIQKLEEHVHKQGYWAGLPEQYPQAIPV